MNVRIYISHATLYIFDAAETLQENEWTSRLWDQGFARRPTTMNLVALVEEDGFIVDLQQSFDALRSCSLTTSFSLLSQSGRILLSGGGSRLGNLDRYLSNELHLPVEFFNPFSKVRIPADSSIDPDSAPQFAVAVGLAVRRGQEKKK